MLRHSFLALAAWATTLNATGMRRVARIPSGPYHDGHGRVVCCDSDHDGMPELLFHTGTIQPYNPLRIEIWEHQGWNRISLAFADTGADPPPPGITTGNSLPFAAGDIDDDGLTDIACIGAEEVGGGVFFDILMTLESPDSLSYPCSLSWYYRYAQNMAIPEPTYLPPDLDQDGHREIVMFAHRVWENTGDNRNEFVWQDTVHPGYRSTYGDFDVDGKMNFASASLHSTGTMSVWECTGDDQYDVVFQDTVWQPNGADLFTTNDIDGDGKPEFYVAYENVPRGKMYLYMWEADQVGSDAYHRTLVDSVWFSGTNWGRISECGDIDADGIDECIWTTPNVIKMYKATGNDQLQEVWHWDSDHAGFRSLVSTVYDINNDGYNELITAGNAKTSVFEVEAVVLLAPNGGSCSVGDTVSIRWATHTPPRCDSLSLFLRRDSLWHLSTIATGLPGTDTAYRWVVPSGVPETARVVVIAYGPGWQFDMSDSVITFIGGGVAEGTHNVPLHWSLSVSPNPARGAFSIRYEVPLPLTPSLSQREREGVREVMSLGIYDVNGRLVRSLSEGDVAPGRYEARLPSGSLPAGIYFLRLDTPG
ncbi:hypothetical protein FJY68_14290, partial [candidate division WOR-3 bacterium]|nr:hypothetical protein [candidate division WOR-3 bacterium]